MKKVRNLVGAVLLTVMIAPAAGNAIAKNTTATENRVEVCFSITSSDGTVRRRTILFPESRATSVIAFYAANPSPVVNFTLGACE